MSIVGILQDAMKVALRAGDKERAGALRTIEGTEGRSRWTDGWHLAWSKKDRPCEAA
ncbi:MAG: hypothetical protein ACOX8V_00600 [Thermoleophilia bacterium]|jgi:hypothetical protein